MLGIEAGVDSPRQEGLDIAAAGRIRRPRIRLDGGSIAILCHAVKISVSREAASGGATACAAPSPRGLGAQPPARIFSVRRRIISMKVSSRMETHTRIVARARIVGLISSRNEPNICTVIGT